jgi:Rrf2 family iron-sulfur cluster assembly transcriptional regulator
MRLSTRTTYGLKALIFIAKHSKKAVSLSEISEHEGISIKYLEAIFSRLKKAKIVTAGRGASGGYSLNSKTSAISLNQIFEALEGKKTLASCNSNHKTKQCSNACKCAVSHVTDKINQAIEDTLEKITLKDLI